jgi:hypothetical protein
MEINMIRKLLFITFLMAFPLTSIMAQQKTNYSGTWKLNVAKSDFGVLPGPSSRTDVITHKEPQIAVDVTMETPQGNLTYTVNYSTDGKEVTNKVQERESKSTAKWDGNNLVVNTKLNVNDVNAVVTWVLSADGKTLTISVHLTSAMGEADQKLTFEKQDEGAAAPTKKP